MADWPRQGARSKEVFHGRYRIVRQRQIILAQQHTRAVRRAALPGHQHPRQCRSSAPLARRCARRAASARDRGIFDGWRAGFPMGGYVSRLHGPHRRHLGDRQDLAAWHRAPRKPDHRDRERSDLCRRRLQGAAENRPPDFRRDLGRVAVFTRVVARGSVARRLAPRHDLPHRFRGALQGFHSRCRCQRFDPSNAHMGGA